MKINRMERYWAEHRPATRGVCSLQDDGTVANGPGATVRADINSQIQSLQTMNSGAAAPGTTWANMLWADTTNTLAKKRNNANGAWNTFADLDFQHWLLNDGAVGTPAYSFNADPDSGIYRIGANNIGVAVNGAKVLDVGTGGLGVTGVLSTTGQLSVGSEFKTGVKATGTTADNTTTTQTITLPDIGVYLVTVTAHSTTTPLSKAGFVHYMDSVVIADVQPLAGGASYSGGTTGVITLRTFGAAVAGSLSIGNGGKFDVLIANTPAGGGVMSWAITAHRVSVNGSS